MNLKAVKELLNGLFSDFLKLAIDSSDLRFRYKCLVIACHIGDAIKVLEEVDEYAGAR